MFINARSCGEQRVAALLWTFDGLGLSMYISEMTLDFVFPWFALQFVPQILTTTAVPYGCVRVMFYRMSLQVLLPFEGLFTS